jgi:hypothetical protein
MLVEQATTIEDIPPEYCANGPLDGTELGSHVCIGGFRHVHAPFPKTSWQQKIVLILFTIALVYWMANQASILLSSDDCLR